MPVKRTDEKFHTNEVGKDFFLPKGKSVNVNCLLIYPHFCIKLTRLSIFFLFLVHAFHPSFKLTVYIFCFSSLKNPFHTRSIVKKRAMYDNLSEKGFTSIA